MFDTTDLQNNLNLENVAARGVVYETIDTTLNPARQYATNYQGPLAIVAHEQTAGVDRKGNRYHTPKATGIYYTWVIETPKVPAITSRLAVLFADVIEKFIEGTLQIKWVNDLYLQGKKVAGILVEQHDDVLIIGMALNLSITDFPKEIAQKAGNLLIASDDTLNLSTALTQAVLNLEKPLDWLPIYRRKSYVLGKEVMIKLGQQEVTGIAENIDASGALHLDNGQIIHSGEVLKVNLVGENS